MKSSLRSLMLAVFFFRDLFWLAVILGLLWWWAMDRWTSEYGHQMLMRLKDGEILELKEKLDEARSPNSSAPAPNPPEP
jgi:hypothetical protein